jgi:dienelactone hydrolase
MIKSMAPLLLCFAVPPALAQPISIDAVTADTAFFSPSLSPDGNTILAVGRSADRDDLVRIDWRTRDVGVLLSAHRAVGERIDWVRWKSDKRLIASITATVRRSSAGATGTRLDGGTEYEFNTARVIALDADGSHRVVAFEGEQRRLAAAFASTTLVDLLPADADHVLLGAYGQTGYALWQLDLSNGHVQELERSNWETIGYATDVTGAALMRVERLPRAAGWRYLRRDGNGWSLAFEQRGGEELKLPEFELFGPGPDAGSMWVAARPGEDETTSVRLYDTVAGELGPVVFEHPRADASYIVTEPRTNRLLAACVNLDRVECQFFDPVIGRHLRAVGQFFDDSAEVRLYDMSEKQDVWLLYVEGPTIPPAFYIYDRAAARVELLSAQTSVSEAQLGATNAFAYRTRDGTDQWGYLTVANGVAATGAPLIVLPHGGPESRDFFGYDELVQFLASRGYLVFQPQFRGSAGFGRSFQEAGRRQWGQRMQDDVTDGVRALIDAGRVDARRICIVGASYGGYVALAGAAFTPDLYQCAVSIAGVSDLALSLRVDAAEEGRNSAVFDYWTKSIGDPSKDKEMLERYSPRRHAEQVRVPILLLHGEEDDIVPIMQSEFMDRALREADKEVRFVRVKDSGHSFYSWEADQRRTLYTELDAFLTTHLPR